MRAVLLVLTFSLLSGIGDAQGFIHAGRVWHESRFIWQEALKSMLGFQFGVLMYWLALRTLTENGIVAVEVQTLFWFAMTIIGIAVLSRQYMQWPLLDQLAAAFVLCGIGWLMYRTAGASHA